jgi:hypothetical protein
MTEDKKDKSERGLDEERDILYSSSLSQLENLSKEFPELEDLIETLEEFNQEWGKFNCVETNSNCGVPVRSIGSIFSRLEREVQPVKTSEETPEQKLRNKIHVLASTDKSESVGNIDAMLVPQEDILEASALSKMSGFLEYREDILMQEVSNHYLSKYQQLPFQSKVNEFNWKIMLDYFVSIIPRDYLKSCFEGYVKKGDEWFESEDSSRLFRIMQSLDEKMSFSPSASESLSDENGSPSYKLDNYMPVTKETWKNLFPQLAERIADNRPEFECLSGMKFFTLEDEVEEEKVSAALMELDPNRSDSIYTLAFYLTPEHLQLFDYNVDDLKLLESSSVYDERSFVRDVKSELLRPGKLSKKEIDNHWFEYLHEAIKMSKDITNRESEEGFEPVDSISDLLEENNDDSYLTPQKQTDLEKSMEEVKVELQENEKQKKEGSSLVGLLGKVGLMPGATALASTATYAALAGDDFNHYTLAALIGTTILTGGLGIINRIRQRGSREEFTQENKRLALKRGIYGGVITAFLAGALTLVSGSAAPEQSVKEQMQDQYHWEQLHLPEVGEFKKVEMEWINDDVMELLVNAYDLAASDFGKRGADYLPSGIDYDGATERVMGEAYIPTKYQYVKERIKEVLDDSDKHRGKLDLEDLCTRVVVGDSKFKNAIRMADSLKFANYSIAPLSHDNWALGSASALGQNDERQFIETWLAYIHKGMGTDTNDWPTDYLDFPNPNVLTTDSGLVLEYEPRLKLPDISESAIYNDKINRATLYAWLNSTPLQKGHLHSELIGNKNMKKFLQQVRNPDALALLETYILAEINTGLDISYNLKRGMPEARYGVMYNEMKRMLEEAGTNGRIDLEDFCASVVSGSTIVAGAKSIHRFNEFKKYKNETYSPGNVPMFQEEEQKLIKTWLSYIHDKYKDENKK